jgi:hypothetical protein
MGSILKLDTTDLQLVDRHHSSPYWRLPKYTFFKALVFHWLVIFIVDNFHVRRQRLLAFLDHRFQLLIQPLDTRIRLLLFAPYSLRIPLRF